MINGRELDDTYQLAQAILKEQFTNIDGFQNCLFSQMYEKFCPQVNNSIHIHFMRSSHWCVLNSAEAHITLYDSSFSELELHSITHQLAVIYKPLVEFFKRED